MDLISLPVGGQGLLKDVTKGHHELETALLQTLGRKPPCLHKGELPRQHLFTTVLKKITKIKINVVHTLGLSVIYSIGYRTVLPLYRADGEVRVFGGGGGGGRERLAGLRKV